MVWFECARVFVRPCERTLFIFRQWWYLLRIQIYIWMKLHTFVTKSWGGKRDKNEKKGIHIWRHTKCDSRVADFNWNNKQTRSIHGHQRFLCGKRGGFQRTTSSRDIGDRKRHSGSVIHLTNHWWRTKFQAIIITCTVTNAGSQDAKLHSLIHSHMILRIYGIFIRDKKPYLSASSKRSANKNDQNSFGVQIESKFWIFVGFDWISYSKYKRCHIDAVSWSTVCLLFTISITQSHSKTLEVRRYHTNSLVKIYCVWCLKVFHPFGRPLSLSILVCNRNVCMLYNLPDRLELEHINT